METASTSPSPLKLSRPGAAGAPLRGTWQKRRNRPAAAAATAVIPRRHRRRRGHRRHVPRRGEALPQQDGVEHQLRDAATQDDGITLQVVEQQRGAVTMERELRHVMPCALEWCRIIAASMAGRTGKGS